MSCETTPCTHCADTGRCDCGCHYRVITDAAMSEPVRNPDRLVPQEAADAAMRQYRLLHPCPDGDSCVGCDIDLTDILKAAAPSIRADTLRWAASRARKEHAAAKFTYGRPAAVESTQLDQWADELEAGGQG